MSDEQMRETVRSAIADIVAESPEPLSFEHVAAIGLRRLPRRAGMAWALAGFLAVVLAVGAAALLRPLGGSVPPVASIPSLTDDVPAAALSSALVFPTSVPDGFEPVRAERQFLDEGTVLVYVRSGELEGSATTDAELLISTTSHPARDFPPDIEVVAERLSANYPNAAITEARVRSHPAFLIDTGGSATNDGWTVAVLTLEAPGLISEVQGRLVDPGEVLAVARGLVSVTRAEFEQRAAEMIHWDLEVAFFTNEPDRFIDQLADVSGVESITRSTHRLSGPSLAWRIEQGPHEPVATTTGPATVNPDPAIRERLLVTVTLQDGTDPEATAAAISDLGDEVQITYSPAIGAAISQEFLDALLGGAQIIHEDPIIYQAVPGPQPGFDVSALGAEIELAGVAASTGLSDSTVSYIEGFFDIGFGANPAPMAGPIIHIGSIDDGTRLVLAFANDLDFWEMTIDGTGTGAGGGNFGARYGYGDVGIASNGDGRWVISVRVPLETSVVLLELADRSTYWQRPIAGHGLFAVQGSDYATFSGTVTALAADGTTIDQWNLRG
jgi:hypothetical protein